jgi:hypothetical protein
VERVYTQGEVIGAEKFLVLGDSNAAYRPWEADVMAMEESHIAFITNQHLGYLHAANPRLSQRLLMHMAVTALHGVHATLDGLETTDEDQLVELEAAKVELRARHEGGGTVPQGQVKVNDFAAPNFSAMVFSALDAKYGVELTGRIGLGTKKGGEKLTWIHTGPGGRARAAAHADAFQRRGWRGQGACWLLSFGQPR